MAYFIPLGTPIEIQRGQHIQQKITNGDLCFLEPVIDNGNELVFIEGGSYVMVAKALVIGDPRGDGQGDQRASLSVRSAQNE